MGGIMIEILKDISIGLAPLSKAEIKTMVEQLKAYKLLKGYRSKAGINIEQFIDTVQKVSLLVQHLPEIAELDINPLLANDQQITAVDARVRIG
ncbi:MAG: hypothetical protein CR968_01135 [Flavobacteriia bacterium]|nr:MAG: hypothetical protein CR968_01135 [Flavobacteriia bacterium]